MTLHRAFRVAIFAGFVGATLAGAAGSADAQMMLPGANNGNAEGTPPRETGAPRSPGHSVSGAPPPAPLRPVAMKPPAEDAILGRPLSRDGKSGAMTFDKAGSDVTLVKLKLDGDKISKPQQTCSVNVSLTAPIVITPAGRPAGTLRFDIPLEACPFTIDVLDGAVLVSRADPSCDFTAADCRVTPGGLWGPAAVDLPPSRVAELERQRVRIETTMRMNFRALIKKAGKDRVAVKAIARDQAAFSSQREMTCRDYDQESVHGFCSTQITEARALELLAKFGSIDDAPVERKRIARTKTKAKAAADTAPPAAGTPTTAAPETPPQ